MKRADIEHLGTLSRIALTDAEIDALANDITEILEYVSDIDEIATTGAGKEVGALHTVMREDGEPHKGGIHTETLVGEAPERQGRYVKVKKILKGDS